MENESTLDQARKAKITMKRQLKSLHTVTGIGITRVDRGFGVKVNLSEALAKADSVPAQIEGVPIKIEITGPIRKR